MTVEDVSTPTMHVYLQSSAFEINEYYLINNIININMNRN